MGVDRNQLEILARTHDDSEQGAANQQDGGKQKEIDVDTFHSALPWDGAHSRRREPGSSGIHVNFLKHRRIVAVPQVRAYKVTKLICVHRSDTS
jgi:hypothetical protein